MRQVIVVSAGLKNPSSTKTLADQLGHAVEAAVTARGEAIQLRHVELRTLATDLATFMTTGGTSTPALREVLQSVESADGLIAVSPVFNASYSGLFKMFFDALDREALVDKPTILAATAGTERHSLVLDFAMRPLFAYLKAHVMPTAVFAAASDFGTDSGLGERIRRVAREFTPVILQEPTVVGGLGGALADTPVSEPTSGNFERLLRDHLG